MFIHPKKLSLWIGGYPGPYYSVDLRKKNRLRYRAESVRHGSPKSESVTPTDEQWRQFRETVDRIGVWKWQEEYRFDGVLDGTSWTLDLEFEDAGVACHGSNNYPGPDGIPVDTPEKSPAFHTFTSAVQDLLGGRDFA